MDVTGRRRPDRGPRPRPDRAADPLRLRRRPPAGSPRAAVRLDGGRGGRHRALHPGRRPLVLRAGVGGGTVPDGLAADRRTPRGRRGVRRLLRRPRPRAAGGGRCGRAAVDPHRAGPPPAGTGGHGAGRSVAVRLPDPLAGLPAPRDGPPGAGPARVAGGRGGLLVADPARAAADGRLAAAYAGSRADCCLGVTRRIPEAVIRSATNRNCRDPTRLLPPMGYRSKGVLVESCLRAGHAHARGRERGGHAPRSYRQLELPRGRNP